MNYGMIDILVRNHASAVKRQVASQRASAPGRARLRSRIGFALVEMGLRLQATAGRPAANGRMRLNENSY